MLLRMASRVPREVIRVMSRRRRLHYVDSINSTLRQYHLSPAKNATDDAVAKGFWSDRAIERVPCQRGHLLALMWNDRTRAQGKGASIDNFMRDLFVAARDHGTVVSAASLDALTNPYLPEGERRSRRDRRSGQGRRRRARWRP